MSVESIIDQITKQICGGKKLFLAFDRDGTLVPLAELPDTVFDKKVANTLRHLSAIPGVYVGIISARSIGRLKSDLPDSRLILAGNYGLEIECPGKARFCHPQALAARGSLERAKHALLEMVPDELRTILEDHGLSLCLHFHRTPARLIDRLHGCVREVETQFTDLYFRRLPTNYEVWALTGWDKSHGLSMMLELSGLRPEEVMPFYAGDAVVDEPAFAWINQHQGVSILVGSRPTEAHFVLGKPELLHDLIHRLDETVLCRAN